MAETSLFHVFIVINSILKQRNQDLISLLAGPNHYSVAAPLLDID